MDEIQTTSASTEDVVKTAVTRSWATLMAHPVALIVAGILVLALSTVSLTLLLIPLTINYTRMMHRAFDGESIEIGDLFKDFGETVVPGILTWIVVGLAMTIGFILLVVPGLIVGLLCAFVVPALAYRDADGPIEAIQKSYGLVRSNFGIVIVILLISLLIQGLGALIAFGVVLTLPLSTLLITATYDALRSPRLPAGE